MAVDNYTIYIIQATNYQQFNHWSQLDVEKDVNLSVCVYCANNGAPCVSDSSSCPDDHIVDSM
jgi:sulfur relay (sulfurtransferase) complex TusBCD TusD component (DsrE family)